MSVRALAAVSLLAACAGHYPSSRDPKGAAAATGSGGGSGAGSGLEAAALPMQVLDARTGHQLELSAFWASLDTARAVCVGEEHTNAHDHWVQLEVVRHLARTPRFALGMEMFQRPFQGVLDDFAAGHIDDAALRSRTGYEDRWGYDWGFYAPTIAAAVAAHATLLALNAPRELTKKVAHHGLESLAPDERATVPELELHDAAHRAWFDALMEEMGGGAAHGSAPQSPSAPVASPHHTDEGSGSGSDGVSEPASMPSADAIYTVQVIWDETMADTAAKWLAGDPQRHVVILAGNGHCHDSAIVRRMKRRGIDGVLSVRTIVDDGEGAVADALSKPINDYLVVLAAPKTAPAK